MSLPPVPVVLPPVPVVLPPVPVVLPPVPVVLPPPVPVVLAPLVVLLPPPVVLPPLEQLVSRSSMRDGLNEDAESAEKLSVNDAPRAMDTFDVLE